jgi:nitrite reductase (NO-forming)
MERTGPSRGHRIKGLTAFAVVALAVAGCAAGTPSWTYRPASPAPAASADVASPAPASASPASPAPSASGAVGSPSPAASGAVATTSAIAIEAFDLGFTPSAVTVAAAATYDVTFKNTGAIAHDLTFADGTKLAANAGETVTGKVAVPAAGITFICSIPGHADAGMKGSITVSGQATTGGDSHGGPAPTTDVVADPNAPKYSLYDATAPAVLPGTTHDIDLVVEEKKMTVAPGFVVGVWTFNGTVPGPVIRVHLGDTINVHLKNPATNTLPHSVDFHASQVAWNDEMTSINPGEEKLYTWKADYAGVWMYHCGTAPALHHIANGMYGMVIVEPKGGFKPVDKEFALVQSEWYLGPQGQPASLTKAAAGAPSPDFVVFNGVANQYKDSPLLVNTGKSVRIFVLDAGPNIDSSFHIVGTIFNMVVKEGITLSPSNGGHWGSQAVDLSPAQGAIVELTTAEDGLYPIVTHAFNFVGRGALGLLQAGDGDPKN